MSVMKSFVLTICLILAAQSRQFGGRSQSSLNSEGSTVVGGRFGASTGTMRLGAAVAAGFGAPASSGYSAPAQPAAPSTGTSTGFATGPSTGSSASMDRPTFEQPAVPQAPQAPQVPQAPQGPAAPQAPFTGPAGAKPFACFSADENRISMAKCPMADVEGKCVNMPNCVWGLEGYSSLSA